MTLGPLYIGSTIAVILFQITNLQVVIYYKKYPDDWWICSDSLNSCNQFGILWALDSLHVAFSTHAIYHYLVDLFGDYHGTYCIVWFVKIIGKLCKPHWFS
ncbi:hypothetical protein ARMGADRAFT_1035907 [Armillaria gallica]|uniref:Uncharacterized protein n=1 Tax=Armillaria gallica TaxID=47427 RepID=A0A2H3D539_ARMGA|nr:hypothetical protein ARMGADRAFT_1035907 [Armillaria gallica]